jgi:hypothetical protein
VGPEVALHRIPRERLGSLHDAVPHGDHDLRRLGIIGFVPAPERLRAILGREIGVVIRVGMVDGAQAQFAALGSEKNRDGLGAHGVGGPRRSGKLAWVLRVQVVLDVRHQ